MLSVNKIDNQPRVKKSRGRPPTQIIDAPTTLAECALLLKQQGAAAAVLAAQDLQAYWLSIMSSKEASTKDKLTASRLYADSIGAFDKQDDGAREPARYIWGSGGNDGQPPVEAEIVNDSSADGG